MYLARVVSVKNVEESKNDKEEDVLLELRWFIQTASSLAFTSKTAVGPFVETNHTWSTSSTAVLRIPSVYKPVQQFRKGTDQSSSSSSRQASTKANPSLEHIKGVVFLLPKGWGIKQLQEGLVAQGSAAAASSKGGGAMKGEEGVDGEGGGEGKKEKGGAAATAAPASTSASSSSSASASALANGEEGEGGCNDEESESAASKTKLDPVPFAPAQAGHEMFTGLSDHYKVRGGKSMFEEKGTFMGVAKDEKDESQWRSKFTLSGERGVLDLGSFNDKLSALIAHDQAARHYYAEEHKDEEEEVSFELMTLFLTRLIIVFYICFFLASLRRRMARRRFTPQTLLRMQMPGGGGSSFRLTARRGEENRADQIIKTATRATRSQRTREG
jgi:hypothetical protein